MVQTSARNIQKYTKFAEFEVLYFPHFTTFRDQTLQFYQLLSSCGDGFRSSRPDQNFVHSWNHPVVVVCFHRVCVFYIAELIK